MMNDDLVPVGPQILLPGIPEKERKDQYIPTTATRRLKPTKRERLFAKFYARTGKGADSIRRAGFSGKNPASYANELLHKPVVSELIKQEEVEYLGEINFTQIGVVTKLAHMHNADPARIYNDDGTIKPVAEWSLQERAVLAGIEVFEEFSGKGEERKFVGRTKKVKMADPVRLIELALKYFNILSERVVFPDKDGKPMSPGVQIQNRIEVVFVNPPGPDTVCPETGQMEETVDGEFLRKAT
jgi:phage terminase small subunit